MLNSQLEKIIRQRVYSACAITAFILTPTFFVIGWSARIVTQNDREQKARIKVYTAIHHDLTDKIIQDAKEKIQVEK
jgi:hypothetical protein